MGKRASDPLKIVSYVFENVEIQAPQWSGRYLTGLVVELPNGQWEHRKIAVADWIALGRDEGIGTGRLSRITKYVQPDWDGERQPLDDSHGYVSGTGGQS